MGYFKLVMALVYITLGLSLLMVPSLLQELPRVHKLPLGIVLAGYGIFRLFKWLQQMRRHHE